MFRVGQTYYKKLRVYLSLGTYSEPETLKYEIQNIKKTILCVTLVNLLKLLKNVCPCFHHHVLTTFSDGF
jgi:hypothetical protein